MRNEVNVQLIHEAKTPTRSKYEKQQRAKSSKAENLFVELVPSHGLFAAQTSTVQEPQTAQTFLISCHYLFFLLTLSSYLIIPVSSQSLPE